MGTFLLQNHLPPAQGQAGHTHCLLSLSPLFQSQEHCSLYHLPVSGTVKGGSHALNPQCASILGVIAPISPKMELVLTELNPVPSQQVGQSHTGEGRKLTDPKPGASSALRFLDVEKMHLNWTKVHTGPFNRGTKHACEILPRNGGSSTRTADPSECSLILRNGGNGGCQLSLY